jgi:hypothetical protein
MFFMDLRQFQLCSVGKDLLPIAQPSAKLLHMCCSLEILVLPSRLKLARAVCEGRTLL